MLQSMFGFASEAKAMLTTIALIKIGVVVTAMVIVQWIAQQPGIDRCLQSKMADAGNGLGIYGFDADLGPGKRQFIHLFSVLKMANPSKWWLSYL